MKFLVGEAVYYRGETWTVKEVQFSKEEYLGIYSRGKYAYVEPEDVNHSENSESKRETS